MILESKQIVAEELEDADTIFGIDSDEDESIIQPFDPELIRVETRPMTIDLLLQRIKYEELNLTPDFREKMEFGILALKVASLNLSSFGFHCQLFIWMLLMKTNGSSLMDYSGLQL